MAKFIFVIIITIICIIAKFLEKQSSNNGWKVVNKCVILTIMINNYLHQSTDKIEYFRIYMYRPNMNSIPTYSLPPGYSLQMYKDDVDDKQKWVEIAMDAGEFKSVNDGFNMFEKYFSATSDRKPLSERIHFLVNPNGQYIGTASAGIDDIDGHEYGALEWVSIIPEYQGKKLAKPMVSAVLQKVAAYASKCYLNSQTTSWRAINMYADFGFKPFVKTEDCKKAWQLLGELCHRKFIEEAD